MATTYTTRQGDMWDIIAKKLYDDENGMNTLIQANPAYVDTVIFSSGVVLTVPDYETDESTTDAPPWR